MVRGAKQGFFAGLAVAFGLCAVGLADAASARAQSTLQGPNSSAPILFKADEVTNDQDLALVVARGNVEFSQGERVLRADVVSYNRQNNVVTATGNVSLMEPTGDVVFADYIELSQDLRDGVIQNLRMVLADQSRLAAVSGRRSDGNITVARRVTYSPCELCAEDPTKPPVWQIKAARVTHDAQARQVTYNDAWMEMWGVPVAYTPYLSHPDGTVQRASGFLTPELSSSSQLGPAVSVPYYQIISPSSDVTFEPIFYIKQNPVAAGEYREQTEKGKLLVNGSLTQTQKRDGNGDKIPGRDTRGHVKANGRFDVDDDWRWGFDVERATDDTYLQRYRLMQRYRFMNSNTLTSDIFTEGFRDDNYLSAYSYAFQGLRSNDDPGLAPLVMPLLSANYVTDPGDYGGHYFLDANALAIHRSEGTRDQRGYARAGWTLPYTTTDGQIYSMSLINYLQFYNVSEIGSPKDPFRPTEDGASARYMPQIDLAWRYPFVSYQGGYTTIIEPVTSFDIAPDMSDQSRFPNEDSRTIDFDETSLFRPNRFAGVDRLDGGQRVNYGVNSDVRSAWGGRAALFLGQSYRLQSNSSFPDGSGLSEQSSNYVGRLLLSPHPWASGVYYVQMNRDDYSANRNRATLTLGPSLLNVSASYIYLDRKSQVGLSRNIEQVQFAVNARLTENWRFQARQLSSLVSEDSGSLVWGASAIYEDDCIVLGLDLTRRYIGNRDNPPDTAGVIRLVFRNLGQVRTGIF